ncbi:hypothetical protein QFZ80_001846 [Paenibacillus sp. V4I7]|nr:hypothetical protein [Paenibacillus sp. V4I7]MDQ0915978.1 hypothetical protein [Paenibacillus sp. V4I5]
MNTIDELGIFHELETKVHRMVEIGDRRNHFEAHL